MVAASAAVATANARASHVCDPGYCLRYTRGWLEIPSRDFDALSAFERSIFKHPGDRHPPRGAPVFWYGGSSGHGHIAMALLPLSGTTDIRIRTTDCLTSGNVSSVPLSWVEDHWGQHYLGWTEDLNGIVVPWLSLVSPWSAGAVYLSKLVAGQRDSDSVRRLQFRLMHYHAVHSAGVSITGAYTEPTVRAVQFFQRQIIRSVAGPKDGRSLSAAQAGHLFGPAFDLR